MSEIPPCPKCQSSYVYENGSVLVCPECAYEWIQNQVEEVPDNKIVRDAYGSELKYGDSVTVI